MGVCTHMEASSGKGLPVVVAVRDEEAVAGEVGSQLAWVPQWGGCGAPALSLQRHGHRALIQHALLLIVLQRSR